MLIAFEGIDGSGKSTQAKMLYAWLSKRRRCTLTKEPSSGGIGREIRRHLASPISTDKYYHAFIQSLFVGDRIDHVSRVILPSMRKGRIVITDRYVLSTVVYGSAAGIGKAWLKEANAGFPKADMTFVLDVSEKVALSRKKHRDVFERPSFSKRVRSEYLKEARRSKGVFVIDAGKSPEEVHEEIINIVSQHIKGK